jgi:hypothetical protein
MSTLTRPTKLASNLYPTLVRHGQRGTSAVAAGRGMGRQLNEVFKSNWGFP